MQVQEKNENYKKLIMDEIKNKSGYQTIDEEFEYDFQEVNKNSKMNKSMDYINSNKSKKLDKILLILSNSAYHIYKLQLAQFADNIKSIYKNTKNNEFYITFDKNEEEMPNIILNEKDFIDLISLRDKYEKNDILSSFICKENRMNPNIINKIINKKELFSGKVNDKPELISKRIKEDKNSIKKNIRNRNPQHQPLDSISFDTKNIGNFMLPSFNICHQCKLRKRDEDLIKCQNINQFHNLQTQNIKKKNNNNQNNSKRENPINYFFIGQSAIILINKIYYLKDYDDSVKELIDNYFIHKFKENSKKCEKYYCKNCLRSIYDIDINEIKKSNFHCPACLNRCNCTRCVRYENLVKQVAYYFNNYGDIDKLYNYLIKQNSIFEKLKDHLVLRKFICIDFNSKYAPLKLKIKNTDNENKNKNTEINTIDLLKYKNKLENVQINLCDLYDESNLFKQLYDAEFLRIKECQINGNSNKEGNDNKEKDKKLLGHKLKNSSSRKITNLKYKKNKKIPNK